MYSVDDERFETSKIKCPAKADYQAVVVNDRKQDDMITFGYVRDKWRDCGMNYHLFPPQYLIKIICGYYWNEWIHLFRNDNGDHHKIDVFRLFDI